jgi:hypothetical protein
VQEACYCGRVGQIEDRKPASDDGRDALKRPRCVYLDHLSWLRGPARKTERKEAYMTKPNARNAVLTALTAAALALVLAGCGAGTSGEDPAEEAARAGAPKQGSSPTWTTTPARLRAPKSSWPWWWTKRTAPSPTSATEGWTDRHTGRVVHRGRGRRRLPRPHERGRSAPRGEGRHRRGRRDRDARRRRGARLLCRSRGGSGGALAGGGDHRREELLGGWIELSNHEERGAVKSRYSGFINLNGDLSRPSKPVDGFVQQGVGI